MFAGRIIQTGIALTVLPCLFSPSISAAQIATAGGEIYVNGNVTGDYTGTQANDGVSGLIFTPKQGTPEWNRKKWPTCIDLWDNDQRKSI